MVVASVSAFKLNTALVAAVTPLGVPAPAKKVVRSSWFASNVALLEVAVKLVGTVSVNVPCVSVPPVLVAMPLVLLAVIVELPVQPSVVKVASELVANTVDALLPVTA